MLIIHSVLSEFIVRSHVLSRGAMLK